MVVGASGYLGSEVAARAAAAGHRVVGTSSVDLDITDRSASGTSGIPTTW